LQKNLQIRTAVQFCPFELLKGLGFNKQNSMGKGISKSADLAPFTEWERKAVDDLLQKYKDEDLPFGLSEKQAITLLTDEALVKKVFNFFAGTEKTLSALEMLCSVALLAAGNAEERKSSLFAAFDFNKVGKICSAELVIMVICVVKAYMSVLVGDVKTAEEAMVAKDVEQGIEEIVNNKFGVDGEDITLQSFNEFVAEEFDQLEAVSGDFVESGKVVLKRFGLEVANDEPAAATAPEQETPAPEEETPAPEEEAPAPEEETPTEEVPAGEAPAEEAPAEEAPAEEAPAEEAPAEEAPAEEAPAEEAPAEEAPAEEAPAEEAPAEEAPAEEAPAEEAPAEEAPAEEAPAEEAPAEEAPAEEAPAEEAPAEEAPAEEAPAEEAPAEEAPAEEAPAEEAPAEESA
jgi:Ca2+-binding EF-hand superfamily protein